jgi:hypothetical protein
MPLQKPCELKCICLKEALRSLLATGIASRDWPKKLAPNWPAGRTYQKERRVERLVDLGGCST